MIFLLFKLYFLEAKKNNAVKKYKNHKMKCVYSNENKMFLAAKG